MSNDVISEVSRGEIITLHLDSLSGEGTSVGRYQGRVCFIEDGVPGDEVRARVIKIKSHYLIGKTTEVISASPRRAAPVCGHFGECGGCRWQNLGYDAQLEFKLDRVREAFRRIGFVEEVEVLPVLGSDEIYNYRNKMEFTFSDRPWLSAEAFERAGGAARGLTLGLHAPGHYDRVINLTECFLQSEESASILRTTREHFAGLGTDAYSSRTHTGYLRHLVVREGKRTGETMVNIVTASDRPDIMRDYAAALAGRHPGVTTVVNNITDRKSMVARGVSEKVVTGTGVITEMIGGYRFRISANSFFQTNTAQAEKLFGTVLEMAELSPDDVVYDLYCGTGTIGIFLSRHAGSVVGIESIRAAVEDAKRNAEANGVTNAVFICGELPGSLEGLASDGSIEASGASGTIGAGGSGGLKPPTVVVVDPPRVGLHKDLIGAIVELAPRKVVYVSCNPVTQARDVRLFAESGYMPGPVRPVDMFPHTDHIETVVVLAR